MSTVISRHEKLFSLQLWMVDAVGTTLLQNVTELLTARQDVTPKEFFQAISRGTPSWGSEFINGKRTTNDLRLVIKIARFFGVSVGFLLNEQRQPTDAQTVSLLGAWDELTDQKDREAVLRMVLHLRGRRVDSVPAPAPPEQAHPNERPETASGAQRGRKRR